NYELLPFNAVELAEFSRKWFAARSAHVDDPAIELSAARFQQHISDAGLGYLIRVPLIATIAAMVYENDLENQLPTGRAGLYERFVSHYLYGRTPIETLLRGAVSESAASGATNQDLRSLLRAFLEAVADKFLAETP